MAGDFFGKFDLFDRTEYEDTPLLREIESLAAATDNTLDDFEQGTMRNIYELAESHYGEENLPEIWKIWADYHRPDLEQYMGDL